MGRMRGRGAVGCDLRGVSYHGVCEASAERAAHATEGAALTLLSHGTLTCPASHPPPETLVIA